MRLKNTVCGPTGGGSRKLRRFTRKFRKPLLCGDPEIINPELEELPLFDSLLF